MSTSTAAMNGVVMTDEATLTTVVRTSDAAEALSQPAVRMPSGIPTTRPRKNWNMKASRSAPRVGHHRPCTRRKDRRRAAVPRTPSPISTGNAIDHDTPSQTNGTNSATTDRARPPNMSRASQMSGPSRPVAARRESRQSGVPPR